MAGEAYVKRCRVGRSATHDRIASLISEGRVENRSRSILPQSQPTHNYGYLMKLSQGDMKEGMITEGCDMAFKVNDVALLSQGTVAIT